MSTESYTFPESIEHPAQTIQRDQRCTPCADHKANPPRCWDCMDTGYQMFGLNAYVKCRNPRHMYDPCRDCGSRYHSTCR